MLRHRVLTALVGVPIILAAIWFGPPWLTIIAAAAAVIGVWEAYRLYPPVALSDSDNDAPDNDARPGPTALPVLLGGTWAVALVLAGELAVRPEDFGLAAGAICVVGGIIGGLWMIAAWHGRRPAVAAAYLTLTPIYIGGALACAVALRGVVGADVGQPTDWTPVINDEAVNNPATTLVETTRAATPPAAPGEGITGVWLLPDIAGAEFAEAVAGLTNAGGWWLLLGILTVYATDTAAYAVGRLLGRHPIAPGISPGKNWEGAAGGMAGAVITVAVLGVLMPLQLQVWQLAAFGVILGVTSPAGDLLESKIKRLANVKDSGSLFPGHGGMLDRLDSLLPSLTLVYLLAAVVTVAD